LSQESRQIEGKDLGGPPQETTDEAARGGHGAETRWLLDSMDAAFGGGKGPLLDELALHGCVNQ
jgi:hypothetical protein